MSVRVKNRTIKKIGCSNRFDSFQKRYVYLKSRVAVRILDVLNEHS